MKYIFLVMALFNTAFAVICLVVLATAPAEIFREGSDRNTVSFLLQFGFLMGCAAAIFLLKQYERVLDNERLKALHEGWSRA